MLVAAWLNSLDALICCAVMTIQRDCRESDRKLPASGEG
jgi:hypothetical protein